MQMRLDVRGLSLCLLCIVGFTCTSSSNEGGTEGEICGGFAGVRCAADAYCDYTNNDCGAADGAGTCKRRPEACTDIFRPVCACNGEVYGNECDAAAHGFDVSTGGSCQPPAGYFSCGGGFCNLGAYCRHESDPSGPAKFSCVGLPSACSSAASCDCLSAEACGTSCTTDAHGGLTLTCP